MSVPDRLPSIQDLISHPITPTPRLSQHEHPPALHSSASFHSSSAFRQPILTRQQSSHCQRSNNSRPFYQIQQGPRDQFRLPSINEVLSPVSSQSRQPRSFDQAIPPSISASLNLPKSSTTRNPSGSGYPCERCGRLFSRKADALKHIRVVHDRVKNFECSVCGRKFARKDYCVKHEKSLHNIEPAPSSYRRKKSKE